MPPPLADPPAAGTGADGPDADTPPTPLTRGTEVGVVKGPLGPALALRGAGLGALCPDIIT